MQMAESRHGCTPAQHSMCSSNPLAFNSRFSAVAAELLIDMCPATNFFFWYKFLISDGLPEITENIIQIRVKDWDFRNFV